MISTALPAGRNDNVDVTPLGDTAGVTSREPTLESVLRAGTGSPLVGTKHAHADAETVTEFLSRTGYQLPVALADLIDNAIDANASSVHIGLLLLKDRPATLTIADNGCGMDSAILERAVSLEKDPDKQNGRALGRYGAGLKAASFSLGRVLTIATRTAGGRAIGAQLDREGYTREYEYGVLSELVASQLLGLQWGGKSIGPSGTVLLISGLSAMVPNSNTSQDLFLDSFKTDLDTRLGLVFHRFIESRRLKISKGMRAADDMTKEYSTYDLAPVNPFAYPTSGHPDYPLHLEVSTGHSTVPVALHLWPKQGRTKATRHENYEILGRSGEWQGFYFYRWDRMLQAGGWNNILGQEPHTSYARIAVDLPDGSDHEFRPTLMKDRIENARPLLDVLTKNAAWSEYIGAARRVYRGEGAAAGGKAPCEPTLARPKFVSPGQGPSVRIRPGGALELDARLVRRLGRPGADAVAEIVWQTARHYVGRKRLGGQMKGDWDRLEIAVRTLGGRRR